jgi:hypothetical protein
MLQPDASVVELLIEAQRDPHVVLRICMARLIEARDIATINFDEYRASEIIREVSGVLGVVAQSMKDHANRPINRPRRRASMVAEAVARPAEIDDTSEAWKQI